MERRGWVPGGAARGLLGLRSETWDKALGAREAQEFKRGTPGMDDRKKLLAETGPGLLGIRGFVGLRNVQGEDH